MIHDETNTSTSSWKEVEMKFALTQEQFREVGVLLKIKDAFVKSETNTDYYFQHPIPGYFQRESDGVEDKYLRIRETEDGVILCYKQWFFPSGVGEKGYCDEYEVKMTDEKKVLKIFELLGFKASLIIKKHRDTFKDGDYEIALDHVEALGYFMEIEAKHTGSKILRDEFHKILEISRAYGIQDTQHEVLGYVQLSKKRRVGEWR